MVREEIVEPCNVVTKRETSVSVRRPFKGANERNKRSTSDYEYRCKYENQKNFCRRARDCPSVYKYREGVWATKGGN